jgi:dipeptidase E
MSNNICADFSITLAGGFREEHSIALEEMFVSCLRRRRMLFVANATAPHVWSFDRAFEWLMGSAAFRRIDVTMLRDTNASDVDLSAYDALYLMDGKAYQLLAFLQRHDWFAALKHFLENDGTIYGNGAGATVLGHDISPAQIGHHGKTDAAQLAGISGMDIITSYNFYPHYRAEDAPAVLRHVTRTGRSCLAVSTTGGLYVCNDLAIIIGDDVCLFRPTGKLLIPRGTIVSLTQLSEATS